MTAFHTSPPMSSVGIIGLGAMGGPISAMLLAAGRHVVGCDVDEARRAAAANAGCTVVSSVAEAAARSDLLLTSLPSAAALQSVVGELVGVAAEGSRCQLLAELSTLSLDSKVAARDALRAVGVAMLDCPVSGTAVQVSSRDIAVYASGEQADYERCAPVLRDLARSVRYVGEFGTGTKIKFVANLLVAVHVASAAEALVLARRAGLDLAATLAAVTDGAGTSRMLEVRGPLMVEGRYLPPSMSVGLFAKDLRLIREYAASVGSPLPLLECSTDLYQAAALEGRTDQDTASLFEVMAARATARDAPE